MAEDIPKVCLWSYNCSSNHTITGKIILKDARHEAYATITLMFLTYFFLRSTRACYDATTKHLPLEVATVLEEVKQQRRDKINNQLKTAKNSCNQNSTDSLGNLIDDRIHLSMHTSSRSYELLPMLAPKPFSPDQLGREEVLFGSVMRERWVNW